MSIAEATWYKPSYGKRARLDSCGDSGWCAFFSISFALRALYAATLFYPKWLSTLGLQLTQANVQFWIIAVPVFVAFIAVMGIGAWIGWTMATTPTPKPIEEITSADETKPTENKEP